jgi:uncharacterized protein YbbC (DUF1343 family)
MSVLKRLSVIKTHLSGLPKVYLFPVLFLSAVVSCAQMPVKSGVALEKKVQTGADQTSEYLPLLTGKTVALVANPTSIIGKTHLVDSLKSLKVNLTLVFAPEHGFRGEAEAGESVADGIDKKSGVRVVSLYGNHKKPSDDDLKGIDIVVFDIQDVGARFYTYISTLQYVMEACADHQVEILVLDRPNPNGHYADGPVLDPKYASFVGMQPIPVVHGMTIGEYAGMLIGEKWLSTTNECRLKVVRMKNWRHSDEYVLPVPPSPNLPNQASIRLYPSLCLFEGTNVSLGRGTGLPFQCYGFPGNLSGDFRFTPVSLPGKALNPPFKDVECTGENLSADAKSNRYSRLELKWLIKAYNACPDKNSFFNDFFNKLAGTDLLARQIREGLTESDIRKSWEPELEKFKKIRSAYLLYPAN